MPGVPDPPEPLRVDRSTSGPDAGIVVLTLNLPQSRNAMKDELTAAWADAVAALRRDRSVRCVVVTGAGSAFCAGGDVSWLASEPDAGVDALRDRMLPFYETWLSLGGLDVPSIAAVNGPAIGAGAALALSCDIRYAGPSARFAVPFAQLGMHAGMASTWLLPEVVGIAAARELLLTGRVCDAAEMVRLGVVTEVFEDGTLMDRTMERARLVASGAPVAQRLHKVALSRGGHASFAAALQWESVVQPVTLASEDLQEGLLARRQKRPAAFSGR